MPPETNSPERRLPLRQGAQSGWLFALAALWFLPLLVACIWDSETVREEVRGLPSVEDAIFGKYPVHTVEYWEWRVDTSARTLDQKSNDFDAMNDLAVACEKLGDVDRAIDIMERKLALDDRAYTTHANLGTFLVHKALGPVGKEMADAEVDALIERGLSHLKRAVQINPDAHFGREKYQIMAVEWTQRVRKDPELAETTDFLGLEQVRSYGRITAALDRAGIDLDVLEGVVGMMRFGGGGDRPWPQFYRVLARLYSVMGTMYRLDGPSLHPSFDFPEQLAAAAYQRAKDAGAGDAVLDDEEISSFLEPEINQRLTETAARWRRAYQEHERALLREGRDPTRDSNWTTFYEEHGHHGTLVALRRASWFQRPGAQALLYFLLAVALPLTIAAVIVWRRRRRQLC